MYRLLLLASPYVSLCSIFDYSTSYVEAKAKEGYLEAAYKGRDPYESAKYKAKEAAAEGFEKASEAWQTTKGKELKAADKGPEKASEAWETTKGKTFEAADKGSEKASVKHGRLSRARPVKLRSCTLLTLTGYASPTSLRSFSPLFQTLFHLSYAYHTGSPPSLISWIAESNRHLNLSWLIDEHNIAIIEVKNLSLPLLSFSPLSHPALF